MRKTLVLALLALTALIPGAARVPLAHAAGTLHGRRHDDQHRRLLLPAGVEDDCPWHDGLLDEHRRRQSHGDLGRCGVRLGSPRARRLVSLHVRVERVVPLPLQRSLTDDRNDHRRRCSSSSAAASASTASTAASSTSSASAAASASAASHLPPPPVPPPPPPPPGPTAPTQICRVPGVVGRTIPGARTLLKARHCNLGRVSRAFSNAKKKGRVLSQRPKPGTRLALNARVNVVVGRGPRRPG